MKKSYLLLLVCSFLFAGQHGNAQSMDSSVLKSGSPALKSDSLYRQAQLSFEQQDLLTAYQLIQAAIAENGEVVDYWQFLLQIQHQGGDLNGAAETLTDLIRLQPGERQHYLDRGFILAYLGNFEESLHQYDQLIQALGKDDQVYTARATVYRMMDEPAKAIAELEDLLAKGTDKSIGYVMLGELYLAENQSVKAMEVVERGLSTFPDEALLLIGKADVLSSQGKTAGAFESLSVGFGSDQLDLDYKSGLLYRCAEESVYSRKDILSLADRFVDDYPTDPRSFAVRGDIYGQYGELDEARVSYLKALEINRYIPTIWQQLIYLSFMRSDWKEAQQTGRRAINLFPNDPNLLFYTGNAFTMEKKHEEARSYLEAALNNAGESNDQFLTEIYGSLGSVYHALGMYAESDVAFREALAIDSLDTFSLNNYAYYLAERNENLEEAKRMSGLTLELYPNNANNEDTYAWILYKLGEYKEALVWIKKSFKNDLDGPSAVLLEHYGDILYRNGKSKDAVTQWKNALKVTDSKDESFERLSRKIQEKKTVD